MLKKLKLYDFRNHTEREFIFSSSNVVFYGANGRGKTNVLEAISILSVGKSWREQMGRDLISDKSRESEGIISSLIEAQVGDDQYRVLIQPRSRSFERNGKKISLRQHFGRIPTLLFVPEHLGLFRGTKRDRLSFFDRFLVQIFPMYRQILAQAIKASRQKGAILRQAEIFSQAQTQGLIDPWNKILAQMVPQIFEFRSDFLRQIAPIVQEELQKISGNADTLEIRLVSAEDFVPTEAGVLDFFQKNTDREWAAGKNLISPSRDDFQFFLRGKPILSTASRGEERSVLLALLSAKKKLLQSRTGVAPILLLDDVFSELDASRQTQLEKLCEGTQVFFTTTHLEHFQKFSEIQKFEI